MKLKQVRVAHLEKFIDRWIEEQMMPGAVLAIVTKDDVLYQKAFGTAHSKEKIPMSTDTIFDLASLTKVCATTPAILHLIESGSIDLNDRVSRILPFFNSNEITIKHLLTHTSGLPASLNFHRKKYTTEEAVKDIANLFKSVELDEKVIYSDLNFILLGYIVEVLSSKNLADYCRETIYGPLGMNETFFNPDDKYKKRIAATEYREHLKDYQWGSVHDENADAFGGVSGHAGLFSTVGDLTKYVQCLLNLGRYEGKEVLSPPVLEAAFKNYSKELGTYRGLGWQLVDEDFSPVGHIFPQDSIGHTGFTGTSLWFNPRLGFGVILLTNRVHYGRDTDIIRFRRILHTLAATALETGGQVPRPTSDN
ncbi:serine hydrolase domain-containing protein [Falsibacillus pallidus]|uniref:CubicO group peptidase (Beta-lactamase class C family) n=1 Tax=Falsibacillus pallidus TaxID=493781 RepID=A0A370G0D8_9BACI|nr:serine hydrolase domain-containing protein [Falsibacillus pallidus]RDI36466.1 CubicO group peptidase (beta-lactamase class C family) [Falsibacillus pallidus]